MTAMVAMERSAFNGAARVKVADCREDLVVVSSSESETEDWTGTDEGSSDEWDKFDWLPAEYQTASPLGRRDGRRGAPKRRKLSQAWLTEATSLGGHPKVADLFAFMRRRETARIRKEMGLAPSQWYPEGDIMRSIFLTNVRRQDDVTTRALRAVLHPVLEVWKDLEPRSQHRVAGLMVFHCALWRAFGTKEFIQQLGFAWHLDTWDASSWHGVVELALSCWRRGVPCFSQAYCPARTWRKREISAARHPMGEQMARSLFQEVCQQQLGAIWHHRYDIVAAATGHSWRQVVQALMAVPHYGGTGFLAKEVAQDLLWTPLFCAWNSATGWENLCRDLNDWCPVGPGARRALNRLHNRPTRQNCYSSSRTVQETFVRELLAVYSQRHLFWNPSHLIDDLYPSGELTLHDVQFQLCEFDKYERARNEEGYVRRYTPSSLAGEQGTQSASIRTGSKPPMP